MQKKTRKQRGGGQISNETKERIRKSNKQTQSIHCLSQLKRFAECLAKGHQQKLLQFGYNLGRLQELCGETTHPEIWWKPIETAIESNDWISLNTYLEELREILSIQYDEEVLKKGC